MKTKLLATLGAAAFAMGASVTASQAQIIAQPGETMGVALGAPLPEGVFFVDLENYGKRDNQDGRLGVNIPLVAWSTPFSFYDTRIEVLYAAPWTHVDSGPSIGLNRVDAYSQALLIGGAHDFGNGFNASLFGEVRPQDNFTELGRGTSAGFRLGLSYVKDGYNASATFHYFGNFGGVDAVPGIRGGFLDNAFVDFTLAKTINKVTFGFVGTAWTDVGTAVGAPPRQAGVAIGGLLGYDFGKFTLQGMVTREVYNRNGGYGLGATSNQKETRGWMRIIVPLYVAPAAPVVKARY